MNKPVAITLIIFFILLIIAGVFAVAMRGEKPQTAGDVLDSLFPEGGDVDGGVLPGGDDNGAGANGGKVPERQLTQVYSGFTAGFKPVEDGILYIEKDTGHVYKSDVGGTNKQRISNTTIPKIFNVIWSADGSKAIIEYVEGQTIKAVSADFRGGATEGVLLPAESFAYAYSPSRDRIFYLVSADSKILGVAANPDNSSQTRVFSADYADFAISWPTDGFFSLLTSPSGNVGGNLYKYNLSAGRFEKIFQNTLGLEALWSPDGGRALVSSFDAENNRPRLFAYDSAAKQTMYLAFKTMAGKCAWSNTRANIAYCAVPRVVPEAVYPDEWFSGEVVLRDDIWEVDVETNKAELLFVSDQFDVLKIKAAPDDSALYFIDKNDGSLWSLTSGK